MKAQRIKVGGKKEILKTPPSRKRERGKKKKATVLPNEKKKRGDEKDRSPRVDLGKSLSEEGAAPWSRREKKKER